MAKQFSPFTDIDQRKVNQVVNEYIGLAESGIDSKKAAYQHFVNHYYDLVTDFYELGWGKSFHFAPLRGGGGFKSSQWRHQQFLAHVLDLKPNMHILDIGCGIGGPMANLARYYGAQIDGINNNAYQIQRAKKHTRDVENLCHFIVADFMQIPQGDNHYDGAISIEAMTHAPDRTAAYSEVLRVMRPGTSFACYEWCLTDLFDSSNEEHMKIKEGIMTGSGLPNIATTTEVRDAIQAAGFELVEARDLAIESDSNFPWYKALQGGNFNLSSILRTSAGRSLANLTFFVAERLRLAPKGSQAVVQILNWGADSLLEGGKRGLFTPMYFFHARKPQC